MKNHFTLTINYKTDNNVTEKELPILLREQWEQTAAAMEGDEIEVISITQTRDTTHRIESVHPNDRRPRKQ